MSNIMVNVGRFLALMSDVSKYSHRNEAAPLVDPTIASIVQKHQRITNTLIIHEITLTFFSLKTLERSYLYKMNSESLRDRRILDACISGIHYDPVNNTLDVQKQ